jgi:glutathione S-transferase
VDFDEYVVSLGAVDLTEKLLQYSDSARVPVLNDGELTIWDSLAICEYINDVYLDDKAWPQESRDRALARAVTAEMHSAFVALRSELPMNCRARRHVNMSEAAIKDIQRIDDIWSKYARADAQGDLRLFGRFSIADCFFAPVVMRFITYEPELSDAAQSYVQSLYNHPSLQKWVASALQETEILEVDEAGVDR